MVLSHGNSGKVLSKTMSRMRLEYLEYPDAMTDEEKAFLESTTVNNAGEANEDNWTISTIPFEWLESKGPDLVDIRKVDPLKDDMRD